MCLRKDIYVDQYMQMGHGGPVVRDAHLLEWLQKSGKGRWQRPGRRAVANQC